MKTIYLDYNSTSPMRPEVISAMEPFFNEHFGNPSSFHRMGQKSRAALEEARKKLLALLGKNSGEIIFTSSATEANNLALRGFGKPKHIVASAIEHLSVLKPLEFFGKNGTVINLVPPDEEGIVSATDVEKALTPNTSLVTLMAANNETGTLEPVHELAGRLRERGIFFHVDAVQVFGKMPFDFASLDADSISFSAHKIGGPKGIGALWIREGLKIEPLLLGGHHEKNVRAGTENLPAIIGFVKAAELAMQNLEEECRRVEKLRDLLESEILSKVAGTLINGSRKFRLPNTANVSFTGIDTETMLIFLDSEGICVSSGSACTSGSVDPSHVLQAMNLAEGRMKSAVRFSLGYGTREEEIEYLVNRLPGWVYNVRQSFH